MSVWKTQTRCRVDEAIHWIPFPFCQLCLLCLAVMQSSPHSLTPTFRLSFTRMWIFTVFRNVALLLDGKPEPARCARHMPLLYLLVGNIVKRYFLFAVKVCFQSCSDRTVTKLQLSVRKILKDHFLLLLKTENRVPVCQIGNAGKAPHTFAGK